MVLLLVISYIIGSGIGSKEGDWKRPFLIEFAVHFQSFDVNQLKKRQRKDKPV